MLAEDTVLASAGKSQANVTCVQIRLPMGNFDSIEHVNLTSLCAQSRDCALLDLVGAADGVVKLWDLRMMTQEAAQLALPGKKGKHSKDLQVKFLQFPFT